MSWLTFMQLWVLAGIFSMATRKRMIYQEEHQAYRYGLCLIVAPWWILCSVVGSAIAGIIVSVKGLIDTTNGKEPPARTRGEK